MVKVIRRRRAPLEFVSANEVRALRRGFTAVTLNSETAILRDEYVPSTPASEASTSSSDLSPSE